MAELRKMGVRLTAEGVNQYKDDLRSAGREARLMSQETKLAMLELGNNASSADKFRTQLKGLEREYGVQENKLKTLTNSQKDYKTSLSMTERDIKSTSRALSDSQRETQRLENNYRKMGEALGWNAEETKKAKAEWEASKAETKELATSLSDLEKESNKYSKELEKIPGQMNATQISMAEMSNEMARLQKEYIKNGGELAGVADNIEKVSGKVRTFSDGMVSVGDRMTTHFTLPIVAGVAATVKAASDWESAFAGVRKTNDEVVDANGNVVYSYEQLEGELRNLTKQLPATHTEIAGVAEAAGQLGIETDNVVGFTKTMIDMGESTNMSAEQAANSLARLANITGMPQTEFDRLGSSIVALGNNFATTEAEITEMSLRLAGIGNQVGMTEADIVALAAAMSTMGIEAQAGGTSMTQVLKRMQNAVAEGSEELQLFANVSRMSASEFADAFREDPARALQSFVEGLELSSNEGENLNAILEDLGITGIREADTLLRLAGNSELLGQALDMSGQAWDENSALAEEAQIRYETLESQLGMLRNEVVDIAIDLGGPFVAALRDGIEVSKPLLESISNLAKGFTELDEDTQRTILTLLGIGAAAGPVLSIFGRIGKAAANTGDGLAWLVRKVGGMKAASDLANPALTTTSTAVEGLGTTALAAGGAKGVGGFTAALGTAMPWIAGITLAVGAGYGVWKLWGEGVYDSAQRTKRWGSDVGEATDEALTEVQGYSREAIGQFGLVEQGLSGNIDSMVGSFQQMGQAIENDLIRQIEVLKESVNMLPEEIQGAAQEIVEETARSQEQALQIVQENNARAAEIRQNAADNNREITAAEGKMIQSLMQESAQEYLNITIQDADQRREVMTALTGDVENASKEQAMAWVQSLGEQRQATKQEYTQQLNDYKDFLDEQGILGTEAGDQLIELFEEARDASTEAIDQQIAMIAEKYPEIADEIFLANGQIIDSMGEAGEAAKQQNEEILKNAKQMSGQLAETAERNAEQMSWIADEAITGAETWNRIVLDEKTGEIKTNAREEIIEASASAETWNHLRFQLQNADLDSNAKSIIGEAAIVNGHWDGMSWQEKELVLQDDFTIQIYEALEKSGQWNEMSLEEKTALMYSNTPEKMTESLAYLGLWDQFEAETKEINADNYNFINTIRHSEEQMAIWQAINPETKELLGENYDLMTAIFESETRLNAFIAIPDEQKELMANNLDLLNKVTQSEEALNRWNGLPENEKRLIANNTEALGSIVTSEEAYNRWINLPIQEKQILGNNVDLINAVLSSEQTYNNWLALPDSEKLMRATASTNAHIERPKVDEWNNTVNNTLGQKNSNVHASTNAPVPTNAVLDWIRAQDGTYSTNTKANTSTNAPGPTKQVNDWTNAQDGTYSTNTNAATSTNAPGPTNQVQAWIQAQDGTYSTSTNAATSTNAPGPTNQVQAWTQAQNNTKSTNTRASTSTNANQNTGAVRNWTNEVNRAPARKRSVFTTIRETINKVFNRNATGNPYYEGGTTWLGDGGKQEPYLTPSGHFGVSGNDWELHDLPRGTRIWPSRQSFRTSARNNSSLKQYLDQIPKFATGGTINNPYDGYTGLVGEAGPEIFQIAQGKVSITPITQSQRTKVLENTAGGQVDMSETNTLLQSLIQLVAQGQVIQMDGNEVGRTAYNAIDDILTKNLSRSKIMNMKGSV